MATLTTFLLPTGPHKLTATYDGDVHGLSATSNAASQTVQAIGGAAFYP